ncbi:hypothetical protein EST38_g2159 [Candolleomyces aberdarensis]|uniref:Uncharacterized protein n=1 Tax=Candolleomyces aberdarensis TaxID=2316362 RepID=A0A4Q2DXH3_9AGAR|nr:hypothetical protein EST38_g2159 [Candolleomyces aberdarensis]
MDPTLLPPDPTAPSGGQTELKAQSGVGLSDAQLSLSRRQTLDLVNRLHSTGVQVDIDLPQIVVVGQQSSGKSSLIESVSGITLPRAAGTYSKGQPLGQARNEPFGPIIYDKAEVEDRVRRAQRAILSPSKPRRQFLEGDIDDFSEKSELSFSRNVVSLSISGPEVADLSFCDLPGLIASVGTGRGASSDIGLVEGLIKSYITKPSCIILLTVACETDFENQGAYRLAKLHDPDGKRTIGVLTKPDRIPTGEEKGWIDFIRNEREPLENNWYCVKQPSSSDLKQKITWHGARQREEEYFAGTSPWSELDPIFHKYLRTRNLVDRLSSVLSDLIAKRLPEIQEELEKSILETQKNLAALPPPPSTDPFNDMAALIYSFNADLHRHVMGIPDKDGLLQAIRPVQQRFRVAIRGTAPLFIPLARASSSRFTLPPVRFLDNEEESIAREEEVEEAGGLCDMETPEEYFTSSAEMACSPEHETKEREEVESMRSSPDLIAPQQSEGEVIYVDEVYARAHEARTRELPGFYPFVVQQTFIADIVGKWRMPALAYLQKVQGIMSKKVKQLVTHHFGKFGQGVLEQRVKTIIHSHLKDCFERAEDRIKWLLDLEDLPFTLNHHYLSDYKEKFLAYYKAAREEVIRNDVAAHIKAFERQSLGSSRPYVVSNPGPRYIQPEEGEPTGIAKVLKGLVEMGITGTKPEDVYKILPPDAMAPAINIMADVRAYFQGTKAFSFENLTLAYKRVADNIPLAVDHELVRGIERDVLKILYGRLGINGPDGHRIAKELATESPQIADKRQDLMKRLERLQIATNELLEIGM